MNWKIWQWNCWFWNKKKPELLKIMISDPDKVKDIARRWDLMQNARKLEGRSVELLYSELWIAVMGHLPDELKKKAEKKDLDVNFGGDHIVLVEIKK